MDFITDYLIQSFIGLVLFYLVYFSFLRKQTFFSANRFFLIGSVFFSLLFPFIDISLFIPAVTENFGIMLDAIQVDGKYLNTTINEHPATSEILLTIYFTGVSLFTLRFLFQIIQLLFLIKKYGITKYEGINYVLIENNYSPFSFFNLIFLNNKDKEEDDLAKIIAHEQIHVKQYHSADLILIEILTIIQWFNPVIWFYRYSLKGIHEYLADEGVLIQGYDKNQYQNLLLSQAMGVQVNDLSNNFNQSLIKKRLIMMKMTKSGKWAKLRLLISLPVITYALLSFSSPSQSSFKIINSIQPEVVSTQNNAAEVQKKDTVFNKVEVMPVFSLGGDKGIMKYISENVDFPKKSRKDGVQAKVYIKFVVNEKGNVTNVELKRIDAKKPNKEGEMINCDAPEIEKEALRVIKSLPSFTPGMNGGKPVKVAYTIPIMFKLS